MKTEDLKPLMEQAIKAVVASDVNWRPNNKFIGPNVSIMQIPVFNILLDQLWEPISTDQYAKTNHDGRKAIKTKTKY